MLFFSSEINNLNFGCQDLNDLLKDKDQDIFNPNQLQIAVSNYYEMQEFQDVNKNANFSNIMCLVSLNICSLNSKYDKFKDLISEIAFNFSIIGLQEVWSISRELHLPGYKPLEYATRDMLLASKHAICV